MAANRATIAWHLNNMVPAPAGVASPKTIFASEDGILLCYGITVPDALAGYAPGCLFIRVGGSTYETVLYCNIGTKTTSDFNVVTVAS